MGRTRVVSAEELRTALAADGHTPSGNAPTTARERRESAASGPERRRGADRRQRATPLFSRYSFLRGRRRGDRRGMAVPGSYVDVYEPWVGVSLITIGILCAVDAVLTLLHLQKGGAEANPLMEMAIGHGTQSFILVKCGVTNLGLVILCLHKNFRYVKPVIGVLLTAYSLLFVYHLYLATIVR